MTVQEAINKVCPFMDTKDFHAKEINYCIAGYCMAWKYTNEYSKEPCRGNVELTEADKEGICTLVKEKL